MSVQHCAYLAFLGRHMAGVDSLRVDSLRVDCKGYITLHQCMHRSCETGPRFYGLKGIIVFTHLCNDYRTSVTDANYASVNYLDLLWKSFKHFPQVHEAFLEVLRFIFNIVRIKF